MHGSWEIGTVWRRIGWERDPAIGIEVQDGANQHLPVGLELATVVANQPLQDLGLHLHMDVIPQPWWLHEDKICH